MLSWQHKWPWTQTTMITLKGIDASFSDTCYNSIVILKMGHSFWQWHLIWQVDKNCVWCHDKQNMCVTALCYIYVIWYHMTLCIINQQFWVTYRYCETWECCFEILPSKKGVVVLPDILSFFNSILELVHAVQGSGLKVLVVNWQ